MAKSLPIKHQSERSDLRLTSLSYNKSVRLFSQNIARGNRLVSNCAETKEQSRGSGE